MNNIHKLKTKEDWEKADRETRFEYRDQFKRGQVYKCLKPVRISGMRPLGPNEWQGFSVLIPEGDTIVCAGESMTAGDGVPAIKWNDGNNTPFGRDAIMSEIVGGMWGGQVPEPGYLELVP
jgi:hypothetical protein